MMPVDSDSDSRPTEGQPFGVRHPHFLDINGAPADDRLPAT